MLAVISAIISWKDIQQGFYGALLTIDSVFYSAIQYLYDVFIMLTKIKLMDGTEATQIIQRVYVLIGVVMLFLLSYSLLKSIVNPDNKSIESSGKVIFNIIKAIVLVAFVPTLFDFAFDVQYAVLNQDTIGKLISGSATDSTSGNSVIKEGGINMAMDILQAFIVPTGTNDNGEDITDELYNNGNCPGDLNSCEGYRNLEYSSDGLFANDGKENKFGEFWNYVKKNKNLFIISDIAPELAGDHPRLKHMFLLSTIAAGCVLVLLARYGLSLGLRLVKLAFYELIAPLPILASILPQKKDMLNKWVSATLKTYAEVFIRIAILYLSVYLIGLAGGKITTAVYQTGASATVAFLARAIVILGMVTFLKKAPELISEATGINTDGMSLGIKDQLKQGGFFTAASAVAGAGTGLVRNASSKWKGAIKNNKGKGAKGFANAVKQIGRGVPGIIAGGLSGGFNSYRSGGRDAGSFSEAMKSGVEGGGIAVANREARQARKERYKSNNKNAFTGRLSDAKDSIANWATGGGLEGFEAQEKFAASIGEKMDSIDDSIAKVYSRNENNGNIQKTLFDEKRKAVQQELAKHSNYNGGKIKVKNIWGKEIEIDNAADYSAWQKSLTDFSRNATAMSETAMQTFVTNFKDKGFTGPKTITDLYGQTHQINTEQEYYNMASMLTDQADTIKRESKNLMKTVTCVSANDPDKNNKETILKSMNVQASGEDQRLIQQANTDYETVGKIVSESRSMADSMNGGTVTISDYDSADSFNKKLRSATVEIKAKKAEIERQRAAREASKPKNKSNDK